MTILLITIAVMALIIFAIYANPSSSNPSNPNQLDFEGIKIDKARQCVIIGASFYKFSEIEKVYVWERGRQSSIFSSAERPSFFDLFGGRRYYYLAEINFYLRNGDSIKKEVHSKETVYNLLRMLESHVQLDDAPDTFKPTFMDSPLGEILRGWFWGWY